MVSTRRRLDESSVAKRSTLSRISRTRASERVVSTAKGAAGRAASRNATRARAMRPISSSRSSPSTLGGKSARDDLLGGDGQFGQRTYNEGSCVEDRHEEHQGGGEHRGNR